MLNRVEYVGVRWSSGHPQRIVGKYDAKIWSANKGF